MIVGAFFLMLAAWCLLSLAQPKHHEALLRRKAATATTRSLRVFGALLLCIGLAACVHARGWEQGPVFWAATLMLSALAWVLWLTLLTPRRA